LKIRDKKVFLLVHIARQGEENEDVKNIGIYSSEKAVQAAINRLKDKPGFKKYPDIFVFDAYDLDEDNWQEGFGFDD